MFLRKTPRKKDGKTHDYWSVVENKRVAGGRVVQRHVLYLGEINSSQAALGHAHISCRVRIGIRKRLRAYDAVRFGSATGGHQPQWTGRLDHSGMSGSIGWELAFLNA